jgi:hypothetical protein
MIQYYSLLYLVVKAKAMICMIHVISVPVDAEYSHLMQVRESGTYSCRY